MKFKFGRSSGYSLSGGGGGGTTGEISYTAPTITTNTPGGPSATSPSHPGNPGVTNAAPAANPNTRPTGGGRGGGGGSGGTSPRAAPPPPVTPTTTPPPGDGELQVDTSLSEENMAATLRSGASANGGYYPPPSSDGASDGTPSEEHPEFVDISVVLPDGRTCDFTVEYGKQMMDLLVQVAAGNKLSPASHTIQIYNEDNGRQVDYKASQSIGSLKVSTLHLVSKKTDKRADRPKSVQPFEKTQRLTVNLPRNQKFVTRVNPKLRLADIYKMVCEEKKLDPYKYDLRHPTHPDQALNMAAPLGDYGINEIFVVSVGASESRAAADLPVTPPEPLAESKVESSSAMPRLSRKSSPGASNDEGASSGGYMPGQDGEKKKKKGFLSFLSKKKAGSFKLGATMSSEPVYARSQPEERQLPPTGPTVITHTQSVSSRSHSSGGSGPQSPVLPEVIVEQRAPQPTQAAPKPAPSRRKRAAPAPPQQKAVQQLVSNRSSRAAPAPPPPAPAASPPPPADPVIVESPPVEVTPVHTPPPPITLNHSRNSSHSSGFDESNVSPIESPGTSTRTDVSSKTITSIDATSIESGAVESPKQNTVTVTTTTKMTKSQSMPVKGNRPPTGQTQLISSASLNTLRRKKRKAPAPPPPPGAIKSPAPKPTQDEQPASVGGSTSTQQTKVVTSQQEVTPIPTPSIPESNIKMSNGEIENHDEVMTEERIAEEARIQARLTDLTKDVDDGASTSSFGSLERRGPCQFVPPPPPDTPPPPETPISQERARSFNFSNGGIPTVVDSSIQAHVSSPCSVTKRAHSTASLDTLDDITDCFESTIAAGEEALARELARDEGDFSLPSVSSDVHRDSVDAGDGESTSEGSSVQAYEVNMEQLSTADEEEKKDGEKADSDEDLPLYPQDPEGIVLIKKTSTSEFLTENLLAQQKAEKEELNERKIRGESSETSEAVQQDHVTVVSVGGEPDITAASDSGHSSATMDKSEEIQDVLENEITFGDEDVLYVEPLNPGNPVAKEEYLHQVERERIESAASEEEEKPAKPVEDGPPLTLQEAREAAARAAAVYESKRTPQKSPSAEGPLTTSTPMIQSVSSVPSTEDSFYRAASPVLPPPTVQEKEATETEESGRERKESETLSDEGEVFFAVNDYRIAGLIKEEVVEFSFPKNSKPVEIKQKKEEPKQPMVTSLRSRYNKRPIVPHEPIDLPDLEAMGLVAPKKVLPPPPAEPAPPIPSEPPEPISIRHEVMPVQSEKIYIAPAQESVTDPDMEDGLIEVSATGEVLNPEDSAELSIPNEAEPETLERDRAYEYLMAQKEDTKVESKPVGILKHSSFSESSTSAPTKGILKASSVDNTQADTKPAGILKNKDTPDRIYSSMTSLDQDDTEVVTKQYASIGNLSSEKDEDTQIITRPKINTKRNLGVYGPRPWGASKLKTETNIMEEINTRFSDRYNNNGPTSPTQKTNVQQRLDELGFSPGMERERENVLEEKSLTMMNLKAPSWRSPTEVSVDKNIIEKNRNVSKSIDGMTSQRPQSSSSLGAEDANKSLQSQYEDLQKQFSNWEKQLKANQALLAQKNIPEVSSSVKTVQKTRISPVQSSIQSEPRSPVASSQGLRKIDARYEPPKKTSPDTGGGGRFTTNDLLSARSCLKSSTTEDDEEKCGITVGRVVETVPSQSPRLSSSSVPSPPHPPPVIPFTPAPDTSNFPAPPKRYIIDAPAPKSDQPPSRFAPKLEPREELMITIRNSGGRTGLRRVPVNETSWAAQ